jgi:hypothetical protein
MENGHRRVAVGSFGSRDAAGVRRQPNAANARAVMSSTAPMPLMRA